MISLITVPHGTSEIPCYVCGSLEIYKVASGNVHTMEYKEETYCKDCWVIFGKKTLLEREIDIVNIGQYI